MVKGFHRSTAIYLILLVVLTIPLCARIFGSDLINGHDSMAGLIRALCMNKYMGHGQFLVRWAPEINWGYGYPMFNFYPPLFSFVSVVLFQFTHNMVAAINLACSLFWILSGMGMFLLAREFWGDEGGMLSAVLYICAPYHIVDLYVRGAFAEFSAFAFFPFLLLSILKMSRKPDTKFFLLGVGSVLGLSLAHNIMSLLFFPVAVLYTLYLFFFEKKSGWILWAGAMFIIGLMMSSFFWLPALWEKKFLNLTFLLSMQYDFHKNFISLENLFRPFNNSNMNSITLRVGDIHSLLCLSALVLLPKIFKINIRSGLTCIFFLCIGLAAVFFTLPTSHLFWEHIGLLGFIQFPWRFLAIIVFVMSLIGGSTVLLIKKPVIKNIFLIIMSSLAIFIALKYSPQPTFIGTERTIENFVAMGEGEYTPKWVLIPPGGAPESKFQIVRGKGQLGQEKSLNPIHYETTYQALEPSLVCFNTFYFPGWRVLMDGQEIKPYLNNIFGLILFYIPPGEHDIQVVFGPTPIRIIGVMISWLGAVLLIISIWWMKFEK